jgi:hypothetical protein
LGLGAFVGRGTGFAFLGRAVERVAARLVLPLRQQMPPCRPAAARDNRLV